MGGCRSRRTTAWTGAEPYAFLGAFADSNEDNQALDELPGALGDLPLALEQARAYMRATRTPLAGYLKLLRRQGEELFREGDPFNYEQKVATT